MSIRFASSLVAVLLVPFGASFAQITAAAATATQPVAASLTFDVATIKPSPPPDPAKIQAMIQAGKMPRFGAQVNGSQAEYIYMSLTDLIGTAYGLKQYQITGPDWLGQQRFDIAAKLPEGSKPDDAPAMLQALLADRFKLTVHREPQEHPVMALTVTKGGPKMKESAAPEAFDESTPLKDGETKIDTPDGPARITMGRTGGSMNMGAKGRFTQGFDSQTLSMRLEGSGVTMQTLAAMLSNGAIPGMNGARQVVDATGLKGHYDFTLEIPMDAMRRNTQSAGSGAADNGIPTASDPGGGSSGIAESLQSIGLKLEPRKATVEQLIVDHAEKAPTEN